MKPDLQIVETHGIRLRVALAGEGPFVILIHGWPEGSRHWAPLNRYLLWRDCLND
jgi:pimeloyl-ACP methyl ester carboxylesterase